MDDRALFREFDRAYDMVFKGTVDFFCIKAAADLGLFTVLAKQPLTLEALASATESVPARLEKFLITLQQIGLVRKESDGAYALTALSRMTLVLDDGTANHTMVPFIDYIAGLIESYYLRLADVVRGQLDWTSIIPHPPKTRQDSLFYETLHRSNVYFVNRMLAEHADLSGVSELIDVGGGIGDIALSLCASHPELHVTLINLPSALDLVRENAAARGLAERITPVAVDMYREPYPAGDAVLFSRILYPMNVQFCTMLLRKAYDALPPGGKVLICDMIIDDAERPNYDYLTHYLCAIGMGFSVLEFKSHTVYTQILSELGFREIRVASDYDHVLYQAVKG
jgi:bacteriochlorophyllide d C-20 methyltransferase